MELEFEIGETELHMIDYNRYTRVIQHVIVHEIIGGKINTGWE